jgi:hypothetical protein
MPKKNLEAAHTIISLTLLATGQLILATEKRVYQLMNGVWEPMIFADDPEPEPDAPPADPNVPEPEPQA